MEKYLGIDAGSRFLKWVIIDTQKILDRGMEKSGFKSGRDLSKIFDRADFTGLTGYGRSMLKNELNFDNIDKITEIKAAVKGLQFMHLSPGTVIDIGGQDTKIIKLTPDYRIEKFVMNDKCAAGTGNFIEMALDAVDLDFKEVNGIDIKNSENITINSTCAVFGETEIVQLLYRGYDKSDLLGAVFESVAKKVVGPHKNMIEDPVYLIGGLAGLNPLIYLLEKSLNTRVKNPRLYRYINAIGAAANGK